MTKNGLKIIRRKKPQTTADSFVRDSRLSLKAKGLMSLVLSLPKEWEFSIPGLLSTMNEGKASVYGALGELRKCGYCEYQTKRDEKGKMAGTEYVFYEVSPLNKENEPHPDYPHPDNPHPEKRDTENPYPENQDVKDIEDIKGEDLIVPPYNPPKGKDGYDWSKVPPALIPAMRKWLDYKKEKGQKYKPQGFTALCKKMIELSKCDPVIADRIVEQSMASNWNGIFELKNYSYNHEINRRSNGAEQTVAAATEAIAELLADNR